MMAAKTGKELLLSSFGRVQKPVVSTGILPLDLILGKGFTLGGMYGLGASEGSGKSTMMLQMCKFMIEQHNLNVCYCDVEQGVTDEMLESMGLAQYGPDRFLLVQDCVTFSDLQKLSNLLIETKKDANYSVLIVDSLTSVAPAKIIDGDVEAVKVAPSAKPMSEWVKAVRGRLGVAKIGCVVIGQARQNIGGGMWDPDTYVAMPKAVQHAVDTMITIEHKKTKSTQMYVDRLTPSGTEAISIGFWGKIWTMKNKKGLDTIKMPMPVIFGKGVDNVLFVRKTLLDTNLVTRYGEKYTLTFDNNEVIRGDDLFTQFVAENYDALVDMLKEQGYYDMSNNVDLLLNKSGGQSFISTCERATESESVLDEAEQEEESEIQWK